MQPTTQQALTIITRLVTFAIALVTLLLFLPLTSEFFETPKVLVLVGLTLLLLLV